ncbi:MAG: DUF433 domain-containing protein [Bryobacterales bacterium]|nr:DUF433 domain-containing protein [Bryobacterales bacterium]
MSAAEVSETRLPEEWQDLPKKAVFAAPLVQTEDTRWGRVRFEGTRVPVATLFDYLADGQSLADFLEAIPAVRREQAVAALRLASRVLAGERG